ncbi:6,7-dimethyl-8-ribityllumazine synthase [Sphaeroforma arctica JP610]|uniref:6,7-dimethyl-8-ribityllumazine synthase n=1 Tax=Sphaeroforma arctica JP610 TaxID=667725 RepID=A0A0L0GDR6_9EUKA|nr:6,7-dimethyl-8-ribityllumazine synthase [Sphaeroforma arctica JP610]KNC87140.1 6,7-dimethyl-8-ribityllumazine synthase [Sphaeroforma arctica JP610]|eukprot:XP_014161042.1 6,7-dimethyl-8-ribityllumazine synthase [Sphaeroforma arctica JP610]
MTEPKDFNKGVTIPASDGSTLKVGIVRTRWNDAVVSPLEEGVLESLRKCGVKEANIVTVNVPGAYELSFGAKSLIKRDPSIDAVVCLGTLIKGETHHYEYICSACSAGISQVGLDTGVPVVFGVLMCLTDEQAQKRAGIGANSHNHGLDWGLTAVEMGKMRFYA